MAQKNVPPSASVFNSAQPLTSPLALAEAMITALADLAAAKRGLGANPGSDPALAASRAAVDGARARVLTQCDSLAALPAMDLMTHCAQKIAMLVRKVVRSDDAEDVARTRMMICAAPWAWQVPLHVEGAAPCNAMLEAVLRALFAYIDGITPQDPPPAAPAKACSATPWSEGHAIPAARIHTAVSFAFAGLLRGVDGCVAAERRLQRNVVPDVLSPAFADDLHAAEVARDALFSCLDAVISAPEQRPSDRALRLLARGLHTLLSVEDDGDRAYLHAVLAENVDLLLIPDRRPEARRIRALQLHFFRSVAALLAMGDYPGPDHDDDGDDAPECVA
jgi:hypothetical protein